MRYLINTLQQTIFLTDIKKAIPYDPEKRRVFAIDDFLFDRSNELKSKIGNGAVVDVTVQYQQQLEQMRAQGYAPNGLLHTSVGASQQNVAPTYTATEQVSQAYTVPQRQESIMVDLSEASRAYSGSDAHLHTAHINKGIRPGSETGIIVDPYDDARAKQLAERSRTSYLVDDDSRAKPQTDPRFFRQASYNPILADTIVPETIGGPIPAPAPAPAPAPYAPAPQQTFVPQPPPMAHLYQNRAVANPSSPIVDNDYEQHTHRPQHAGHDKYDPSWGANSPLLAQRRMYSGTGKPHDHAYNNNGHEAVDERLLLSSQAPAQQFFNPLADLSTPVVEETPQPSIINPLAAGSNPLADFSAPEPNVALAAVTEVKTSTRRSSKSKGTGTRKGRKPKKS